MRHLGPMMLVIGCCCFFPAQASPLDDKVAALKDAMKKEDALKPSDAGGKMPNRAVMVAASLNQITPDSSGPYGANNAQIIISQILASYSSEAVQTAAAALLQEIKDEQKAKNDAYVNAAQAVLKKLKDTIAAATKPADLDSILVDLQKYQFQNGYGAIDPGNNGLAQEMNAAFQFTTLWQDYLAATNAGSVDQARNDLRNLAQNAVGVSIIPRSEILAREETVGQGADGKTASPATNIAGDIISGIKTLDEMEPALQKLEAIDPTQRSLETNNAIQQLRDSVNLYNDVKAGVPRAINLPYLPVQSPFQNADIQAALTLLVLQNYFPSFQGNPPAPGEKPMAFLGRIIADAQTRQDWQTLRQAINLQRSLTPNETLGVNYSPNPIEPLIQGLYQEEAGQFTQAVVSYESALKSTSPYVPAKFLGERLAAIQKDHPAEYDSGISASALPAGYARMGVPIYPNGFSPTTVISLPGRRPATVSPSLPATNAPPMPPASNVTPATK